MATLNMSRHITISAWAEWSTEPLSALRGRWEFFCGRCIGAGPFLVGVEAPDTGADAVRENGQIVSVRGLVC